MSPRDVEFIACGSDGGFGIGAGHRCTCNRIAGHPLDSDRPHGCSCGAWWSCSDCASADMAGCAECGAMPEMRPDVRVVEAARVVLPGGDTVRLCPGCASCERLAETLGAAL